MPRLRVHLPFVVAAIPLLTASTCIDTIDPVPDPERIVGDCEANDELREALAAEEGNRLGLIDFATYRADPVTLREALLAGEAVRFVVVDENGETSDLELTGRPLDLTGDVPVDGRSKGADGEPLDDGVRVPDDAIFELGCEAPDAPCGVVSFLDLDTPDPARLEAMILDPRTGVTLYESAASLFDTLDLDLPPGDKCGVVYNASFNGVFEVDDEDAESNGGEPGEGGAYVIPIVLDGDVTFYDINPATAWMRQRTQLALMNLVTRGLEPATGGNDIRFALKAQEAWVVAGSGPSSTDKDVLIDEINDENYPVITSPANDEVSYFFVGYEVDGVYGKAGGVCNSITLDVTFGSDEANQRNHAFGMQVPSSFDGSNGTLYGRLIVMVHEVGHMIGGTHGAGSSSDCAGSPFPNLCGVSIMLGGSGGIPDDRAPYFTATNDANIATCVSDAAP